MSGDSTDDQHEFRSSFLGVWIRITEDYVEFKRGSLGTTRIMLDQIAGVSTSMAGVMKITIETTGGNKYAIATNKKASIRDAIYKAMAKRKP